MTLVGRHTAYMCLEYLIQEAFPWDIISARGYQGSTHWGKRTTWSYAGQSNLMQEDFPWKKFPTRGIKDQLIELVE